MSLHIYFEGVDELPDLPIERDIDTFFMRIKLDGSDYDRKMLLDIERGQYVDNMSFIDRFGFTLRRECLSAGTKGALAIYHSPDTLLYGVEIGRNALTSIVRWCKHGNLLLEAHGYYISCELDDMEIDVICKGRHFTSLDEFAVYMLEEAPYDED